MPLPAGDDRNADQIAYWNGPGGQRWSDRQEAQDILLSPVSEILIARIAAKAGDRVLDIGCGCGGLAIALARQVAPGGSVLGIDISAPMLAQARQVAPVGCPVEFVLADATVHPFTPASFDLLVSRFGVMFFADPVASFANMRKALKPGGRVVFACWREPKANPWMIAPLQAVYRHVPKLPEMAPEDPGPFAFASEARVSRILAEAGFRDVALEPQALSLDIAIGKGLDAAVQSAFEIGPASRALEGHSPETREAARQSVRDLLAQHQTGDSVTLPGSIWLVTAHA
ncbi:MAG: methyltransferase domain-containing protein [Bradyrhizobium sp.]|jgi:ubiquinone/menaquinone biosynthesis C-methylase UbiE|uniref:Methyltransferase domain-containing protein n=4 Tax=Bradyrhizobium TaxID=374 RepID=A0ABS5G3X8_9BRAD|nr:MULTISPECIES: class I SAM-dependent methyltransferase [Bradyrhizobium]RTL91785.1 MAG: class I SAM-dependent methyltransferase [Bradyrhizobiaceae bacterium]MBR1135996.1 methyltransferase domain-containing protein [Bradyrhizobium denitrificans]MCL8483514.1 methyltransferase domain-containing protein [Bradyrhizobium denitrificans]MDU1492210.1 methyltransferase domain-containing protein [Bradyrhizobium sp.]MDU1542567.1 methyltransferase domain-containing protein [Bradyrhizobium sp.]